MRPARAEHPIIGGVGAKMHSFQFSLMIHLASVISKKPNRRVVSVPHVGPQNCKVCVKNILSLPRIPFEFPFGTHRNRLCSVTRL